MARRRGRGPRSGRPRKGPNMVIVTLLVLFGTALGGSAVLFGPQMIDDLLHPAPGIGSSVVQQGAEAEGSAQDTLANFVLALEAGDVSTVTFAGDATPGVPAPEFDQLTSGLGSYTLVAATQPAVMVSADGAQAPIELTWTFPGELVWQTSSQVVLEDLDGQWRVRWDPAILEPSLASGDELVRSKLPGKRAPILGRNGAVLVDQVELVTIGVQPRRVQDQATLVATLADVLGIDGNDLASRLQGAQLDDFVEVATLARADYDQVRDQVFPLPGTVFRQTSQPKAISDTFARALLGRSGEVTADIINANPGQFEAGDIVGLSGLQGLYNSDLAGRPGVDIAVKRRSLIGATTTTGTGLTTTSAIRNPDEADSLFRIEPTEGQPVQTTIDPVMQQAAEKALSREPNNSAFVAIQISTGNVLAVANGPTGATVNNAMVGQYPPGSTFKVVSAYSVLRDRLGPNDPVDCPGSVTIEGSPIGNAENEVFGTISFLDAFVHSCNTAFVNATRGFDYSVLHDTAAQFGLGVDYDLGTDAFSGSVPVNDSDVDLARAAFGQGRNLVSPFSEAVMAASAAGGAYRSPVLVTSPAPATPQVVAPLDPSLDGTLRDFMRSVVTNGTGRGLIGVAGGPVSGKTGTAEFGNRKPPQSHAWFVGFQGDVAFVAFVEAGEFGGQRAAPLAADFLNTLAGAG